MEVQEVSRLSHNFDVIHSHVEHWLYPLVGKAKVPIVSTCHGPMGRPLMHEVHRQFPNAPLVSISFSQRAPLPEANWVANVYHGMPRDLFFPSFKKGQYLVFLGRLSPTKGVVEAIEIARRSSTNLKIAGNIQAVDQDYFRHEIKPRLGNGVEYVGEVNDAQKNELLASAIALLFPILSPEAFGLVLIESLACGTPVIGFDKYSVPEIICEGTSGFLCSSVEDAAKKVEKIDSISRQLCRKVFEERFSVERMATDYLELFESIVLCGRQSVNTEERVHETI